MSIDKAIRRINGTKKPDGVLFDHAQQMYASCGYTTAQEGSSEAGTIGFLKLAAKEKKLYIDVVSLVASDLIDSLAGNPTSAPIITIPAR